MIVSLSQEIPLPRKKPVTWFLIADGHRAQAYVRQRIHAWIPLPGITRNHHYTEKTEQEMVPVTGALWKSEPISDFEAGNDKLGRVFESAGPTRHANTPPMGIREEIKVRFMHDIASRLHTAYLAKAFHYIVLVAPPNLLGEIKKKLDYRLRNNVLAELPKDLTHCNGHDLAIHLEDIANVPV